MGSNIEAMASLHLANIIYAIVLTIAGYFLAKTCARLLAKLLQKRIGKHWSALCRRSIFYALFTLFLITALQQLGFDLSVLLGAAGVLTVGLGFAAKTSASNLISGLFMLVEQPFKIGDTIIVKSYTGVVDSIDLISTKLKTFDNTLIRIPNESLLNADIVNLTHFKTRRLDLILDVEYGSDLDLISQTLLDVANQQPDALKDPAPDVKFNQFASSSIQLKFSLWVASADFGRLKDKVQRDIKQAFERQNINIPYPHMNLHIEK